MKILALDASTKSTGYALYEDDNLIDSGLWKASSPDLINRITKMTKQLNNYLENLEVDKLIIEEVKPEFGDNQKSLTVQRALMWLQAAIAFLLHDRYPNIEIEYMYPSVWRAACGIRNGRGIKREELKQKDIEFAYSISKKLGLNDDEADAICIGYGYLHKQKNNSNWQ